MSTWVCPLCGTNHDTMTCPPFNVVVRPTTGTPLPPSSTTVTSPVGVSWSPDFAAAPCPSYWSVKHAEEEQARQGTVLQEINARQAERIKALEAELGRVHAWTHTYGAELCPGVHPDTYGEGVRAAKDAVRRMLETKP